MYNIDVKYVYDRQNIYITYIYIYIYFYTILINTNSNFINQVATTLALMLLLHYYCEGFTL